MKNFFNVGMEKKSFLKFKKGKQILLLNKAVKKVGSEPKLANIIKIPKTSIYSYRNEIHPLPLERAKKLVRFLKLDFREIKKRETSRANRLYRME